VRKSQRLMGSGGQYWVLALLRAVLWLGCATPGARPAYRVSVEPPEVEYPPEEKQAGAEGDVLVKLLVDANGDVAKVTVVQSAGRLFDAAVIDTVRRWKYEPARSAEGRAVASEVKVAIRFRP
jgi:periplasmic protein TonB